MTHRTSVIDHELRVTKQFVVFSKALLALGIYVDLRKGLFYADHHDDPEIVTTDINPIKKRNATQGEKIKMEQDEKAAAREVDRLVQKPLGFDSFPREFEEYKSQKSLEARIVNYADKWDCLHEAIHEVVCGTNKNGFKEVINKYKSTFAELDEKNKNWQNMLKIALGDNFFDFPDPEKLVSRSPDKLEYKTAGGFIKSLAEGNPVSYFFWLRFNKSLFELDFLKYTFPGWINKFPHEILEDIERVRSKASFKKIQSGLFVPSSQIDIANLTFGESLKLNMLETQLAMASRIAGGNF